MNLTEVVRAHAVAAITTGRRRRLRRRTLVVTALSITAVAVFSCTLMLGHTFYGPAEVLRVIRGEFVPGATFTVGELRLPRAIIGTLAGCAFGIAGVSFQTLLRNPLASPDVIGISSGASAAAVTGIVVFSLSETGVAVLALAGALVTAGLIYWLSHQSGFSGTRLILIGIGVGAVLNSVVSYVLSRAAAWDLQAAMQWLAGSINNATSQRAAPLAVACLILLPVLLLQGRALRALRLGDDAAAALGVRLTPVRIMIIATAVILIAFATAAAGPIAFVAFMAGPIAARLMGPDASLLLPAAMVGVLLVLGADLVGQFAFSNRLPVGVITGAMGAPFLVYLLVRMNRTGATI